MVGSAAVLTGVAPNREGQAVIAVERVVKSFGERHVLGGISFEVRPAETVAIVGASGFGKTTLLNIVGGLVPPTAGRVRVGDRVVVGPQRNVGYLTQKDTLLPWRTALGNVELPLAIHGCSRHERRSRAQDALEQVGLANAAGQYPAQLSGGMRRRVALARMLVAEPDLLLLDEPFSALDAQLRVSLQQELVRVAERLGRPTVLVTHDLQEALAMADRVLVLAEQPARVTDVVEVPYGRPRLVKNVRFEHSFPELERRLWDGIGDGSSRSS